MPFPSILGLTPFLAELSALERWRARNWPTHTIDGGWLQYVLVFLALLMVGVLVMLILRRHKDDLEIETEFARQARQSGLSAEETQLLSLLARLAGMKDPDAIFTVSAAFDRGVSAFLVSERVRQMSASARACISALLVSIKQKLGFDRAIESEVFSSSRQITEGSSVMIADPANPEGAGAIVTQISPIEMVVEFRTPRDAQVGQRWQVRYCDGGSIWEFDATVLRQEGAQIALSHSDEIRFLNRRRFPRVPTKKPAQVARFPFLRRDGVQGTPQFVESLLIEIAGPGIKLLCSEELQRGDVVLVLLHLQPDKTIQSVGKVYRSAANADGLWCAVVNLMSLDAPAIAELAHETSAAEKGNQQASQARAVSSAADASADAPAAPAGSPLPPHRPAVRQEEQAHV